MLLGTVGNDSVGATAVKSGTVTSVIVENEAPGADGGAAEMMEIFGVNPAP